MDLDEMLAEMKRKMNQYDLSYCIKDAYIGEWLYGVAMVPCDWVYPYLLELKKLRETTKEEDCEGG